MSDSTLNIFLASVADAVELAALVPSPPTPAIGPESGYFAFQRDNNTSWSWDSGSASWVGVGGAGGTLPATVQGDMLYATAVNTIAALAKDANATRYLSNTGATNNPAWAQINLANGVTGDLPFANLTQGSALSVLGVTGNATADNASIAAGTDHQVFRRSGTAVSFGAVDLAQSAAITGVLPVANGGTGSASGATILRATGTITNAEYLSLPTATKILVAAPGVGFSINFITAWFIANFTSGAYTGAAAVSWIVMRLGSNGVSSFIANDNTTTPTLGYLSVLNDGTKKRAVLFPWIETADETAEWGSLSPVVTNYTGDNAALVLAADNGGVDFGGGHASNSVNYSVLYTIEATT